MFNINKGYKIINQKLSSPEVILVINIFGDCPSTVHPIELHDPNIYFIVPLNVLDKLLCSIIFATFFTYSNVRFPSCLIFLTFFLSLGASLILKI